MEVRRGRYRNSYEHAEPLTAGNAEEWAIPLRDHDHVFLKGHRIMVQVQSSWFPLTDRNPQVFEDIAKAKDSDFKKATETVFHEAAAASGVELMVMPKQ